MKEHNPSLFKRVLRHSLFTAMILIIIPAGTAHAKDLGGRLGIGIEQTLGGVSGIAIHYWPGQAFGLSLTVGVDVTSFQSTVTNPVSGNTDDTTPSSEAPDRAATTTTSSLLATSLRAALEAI